MKGMSGTSKTWPTGQDISLQQLNMKTCMHAPFRMLQHNGMYVLDETAIGH